MNLTQFLTGLALIVGAGLISARINWRHELTDLINLFKKEKRV